MKNNKKITTKLFIATMLFLSANLNSATHTVTNGNDAGAGSLREIVANANSGDTIIFAPNVSEVNLTGSDIEIDKDLTIIGGTGKTTIYAGSRRIFYVDVACSLAISNLILTGAYHYNLVGGGAVFVDYGTFIANSCEFLNNTAYVGVGGGAVFVDHGTFIANNCEFLNNTAYVGGGAVFVDYSTFIANNCVFANNTANYYGGAGGAVYNNGSFTATNCIFSSNTTNGGGGAVAGSFTATNCVFSSNTANYGGAVGFSEGIFTAINSIFTNNTASIGGAVYAWHSSDVIAINSTFTNNMGGAIRGVYIYLYHSTIDKNIGGGCPVFFELYSYNSIITGNTVADTLNQIEGTISGGNSLIEGENGVTRDLIFGNNTLTDSGYIMPLEYAKTATRLTKIDIEVPPEFSADSIIIWLQKDQRGKERPDSGFVTFGAVEFEIVGIVNNYNDTVKIYTLGHNLYLLGDEIKDAVLYNVLGQKITEYENSTIDLNHLSLGIYFLHYTEKASNLPRVVKLLRK